MVLYVDSTLAQLRKTEGVVQRHHCCGGLSTKTDEVPESPTAPAPQTPIRDFCTDNEIAPHTD